MQPIVRLDDREIIGYEALARISDRPVRSPDWWLRRAAEAGQGTRLEVDFLASAARLGTPPNEALLFVNASPAALSDPSMFALREALPERLVVEITEQTAVNDYGLLREQLAPWMSSRTRFAIDDTGAGYSSLRHLVELAPDFLKLDRTLVRDIDKDGRRNALVRALVAFAREVGTTVIAEGIETPAELVTLLAAEVTLGQGYLLGRPGPAWPPVDDRFRHEHSDLGNDAALRTALSTAGTIQTACEAVVAHLFRLGQVMPSLYLEQNGRLRCVAQRGLWQVLDGLPPNAGITGRVWASGEPFGAEQVRNSPHYLEAVPGAVAEICVPIMLSGRTVGALNVDSLSPLPAGTTRRLQDCASLLSRRLSVLGWQPTDSPLQRAVHGSIAISDATADADVAKKILATLRDASGMDSAAIVRADRGAHQVQDATGPLAPTLLKMDPQSLQSVCRLVDRLSSCYTGSETTGLPYLGSDGLRNSGARAAVLLPLRATHDVLGAIILAHSRPMCLTAQLVEPLELLAGQAAATLKAADLVEELRHQAVRDDLTGVLNRAALNATLNDLAGQPTTILIADLDHFKKVNDSYGHPGGDEALRQLAAELTAALPGTPVYRMGGDEFAILLPHADPRVAHDLAEHLSFVGRLILEKWATSISIGGATSTVGESAHQTLVRADAALLWVKEQARGTVKISTWSTSTVPS